MKVLVLGASGGSGRAIATELLSRGHDVTACVRRGNGVCTAPTLGIATADAADRAAIAAVVRGHDAVVVALGISENPLRVRVFGPQRTPINIRSLGTHHAVQAMRAVGMKRLIVQSTYGIGETYAGLSIKWKILFTALLKPQIADTAAQEEIVRTSDLDWTIVRPVGLTDGDRSDKALVSADGIVQAMQVSRRTVAAVVADTIESNAYLRKCVAVSG